MKIKTYRAKGYMALSLTIKIKDKTEMLSFGHGSYSPKLFASLRTSNKELQAALEKHRAYGKLFFLENTEYVSEPAPVKKEEKLLDKPLEFNNFNELRDYLIKEHGRAPITVSTLAKATREMEKLNLKFTIK